MATQFEGSLPLGWGSSTFLYAPLHGSSTGTSLTTSILVAVNHLRSFPADLKLELDQQTHVLLVTAPACEVETLVGDLTSLGLTVSVHTTVEATTEVDTFVVLEVS